MIRQYYVNKATMTHTTIKTKTVQIQVVTICIHV